MLLSTNIAVLVIISISMLYLFLCVIINNFTEGHNFSPPRYAPLLRTVSAKF